jgi:hypothetical protein
MPLGLSLLYAAPVVRHLQQLRLGGLPQDGRAPHLNFAS